MFSTVDQLRLLTRELGRAELGRRQEAAWQSYLDRARPWVDVVRAQGPSEVEAAYREVLDGRCPPAHGHVLSV
ncbi:DUF2855 family protein [Actinokineospora sp.]|uniref:DUF2855 family protein n=1 Tax=Actinokineospora sp. TaxID=1872133 RepID=UPI004037E0CF